MLAFLGNLSIPEVVLVAVVAVMVFGRRLPEVAGHAARHFRRLRRMLEDVRRETGIDAELRDMRREFRQAEREARIEPPPRLAPPARTGERPVVTTDVPRRTIDAPGEPGPSAAAPTSEPGPEPPREEAPRSSS